MRAKISDTKNEKDLVIFKFECSNYIIKPNKRFIATWMDKKTLVNLTSKFEHLLGASMKIALKM